MSATRDKSQKITFIYSNLYQLYKKGKEAARSADTSPAFAVTKTNEKSAEQDNEPTLSLGLTRGLVIKPGELTRTQKKVEPYVPADLLGKRIELKTALSAVQKITEAPAASVSLKPQAEALQSLKQNLQSLNDLHSRLKFMLQELEDLVKKD